MIDNFLKNPINKFLLWFAMGLFVCLIGISNVFADTYTYNQFTAQLYDNFGPSLSAVTTDQTNGRWQGGIPTMTANSSGASWGISSNMALLANHTYTLTAEITGTYGGRLVLSTYNRIGIGTTLANAKTSYQNNTYVTENYSRVLDNGYTIQFAFTPTTNGSYIVFPFATNYTGSNQYFYLSSYTLDDLGTSGGISQSDINNSLNNQTATLNQSITNSQNNITNALQQTEENINNNINNNYNNCGNSTIEITARLSGYYISSNSGLTSANNDFNVSNYYGVTGGETYIINFNNITNLSYGYICWYNDNTLVSCSRYRDMSGYAETNFNVTAPSTANKVTLTYRKNSNATIKGNLCVNKLDEQTDAINGVNDSINNDNVDENGIASAFNSFNNYLDDNSTITQLITLPVTLYTAILNNLNGTCQPFNLGRLYGSDLILPCINISQYLGNALWSMIDIIISGFAIYAISKKMIKVFNNFSSLREGDVIDD